MDVRAPLQVEVSFPFLQRPTPTYTDGRPTPFIDYRDFPLLEIGGSLTASVSIYGHKYLWYCFIGSAHYFEHQIKLQYVLW